MCIVVPQKITSVKDNQAILENGGAASLKIINAKKGDWVFVKRGYVINKLSNTEAQKALNIIENANKK